MASTPRVRLNEVDQITERYEDKLLMPYILPESIGASYGLSHGKRLVVYEMAGEEIGMEADALALFDDSQHIWKIYVDADTEKQFPYRRPAHGIFRIVQGSEIIGETRASRGVSAPLVTGSFTPFPAYERLRPFFQRLFESNKEQTKVMYREFAKLSLQLTTLDGRVIPTDWIEIGDASSVLDGEDAYQVMFPTPPGFFEEASYWVEDVDPIDAGGS